MNPPWKGLVPFFFPKLIKPVLSDFFDTALFLTLDLPHLLFLFKETYLPRGLSKSHPTFFLRPPIVQEVALVPSVRALR